MRMTTLRNAGEIFAKMRSAPNRIPRLMAMMHQYERDEDPTSTIAAIPKPC